MTKNNNKNRQYTGLVHTPSSMAWLIRKKATLLGQVEKSEKLLRDLPAQIQAVRAEIAALDIVIPMHEVIVDPHVIKGKRPKRKSVLPYGVLSRGIFERLRLANGVPITSLEIAIHIANAQVIELKKSRPLRRAIMNRLTTLARQNKVVRHHDVNTNDFGVWSLPKDWLED